MGPVLTTNARVMCVHGGQVTLAPRQGAVTAAGAPVLRETDLIGAPIVGCAQPPTVSSKPCTTVVAVLPGGSAPTVSVGGLPAHVASLSGITDGVPPGTVMVVSPGQTTVVA
ncbi:hypothetical protein [Miltoncostaea marina]|uniref:hypothetical protein n=1 Tax=Miltoncostaea marina TaxID=2843215 RepID=UPI001C3E297B|nr:hypothetical protein [Miltoncostaea marina]